jgi:hypothetical protein
MRSSPIVRASDSQCRNCPGFDPSILRHSGICGAADEAVLNFVHKKRKSKKSPLIYTFPILRGIFILARIELLLYKDYEFVCYLMPELNLV